jgi:2-(1,2-epoxy-1,2-dihydrophenyl)acetyl-CoA isomerase
MSLGTEGTAAGPTVIQERQEAVQIITLHRPEVRNAMDDQMRAELLAALDGAQADPEIRAVVLRGEGGTFCAGGDIRAMGARTAAGSAFRLFTARRLVDTLVEMPKPVIAAVEGYAVGAGFGLALACDIIVASDTADFRMSFVHRGLAPDSATTYFLERQIGRHRTKELALTGRPFLAEEALRLGVAAKVWQSAEFDQRVGEYATALAAGPSVALGITKRVVHRAADCDLPSVWDLEALAAAVTSTTDDHHEALNAWRAHRSPTFNGK